MILRDCWGYPVKWWQVWLLSLRETWAARNERHCYACGESATQPSRHWPSSMVCDDCQPFDGEHAAAYAHHCETGE